MTNVIQRAFRYFLGFVWTCVYLFLYLKNRFNGRKTVLVGLFSPGQTIYIAAVLAYLRQPRYGIVISGYWHYRKEIKVRLCNTSFSYISSLADRFIPLADAYISPQQAHHAPCINKNRICVFHGHPSKGFTFSVETIRNWDHLFLYGPIHRDIFSKTVGGTREAGRLVLHEVGFPKTDPLVNRTRREWRDFPQLTALELDFSRPLVLYAPSFEAEASMRSRGMEIIDALLNEEINLLVKLHPSMFHTGAAFWDYHGGEDWKCKLSAFRTRPNFRFIEDSDSTPYVGASDIMVTDVSSVSFEAFICGIPVLFFDCPQFFDSFVPKRAHIDPETARADITINAGRQGGVVVKTIPELILELKTYIKEPEKDMGRRLVVKQQLLYNPGCGEESLIRHLDLILNHSDESNR